jgi:demethylspheroidene O-methyltransferase
MQAAADRLWRWRDRLLTSPRFIDLAMRFPPTRAIARSRANQLFDLCAGFVFSQALQAAVQLRLFDILAEGLMTAEALARRLDLPPEAARALLDATCGLRLVERRGPAFGLGPLGAAMLAAPGVAAMVEHHALLYGDLADPVRLLRDPGRMTALGGYWPYAGLHGGGSGAGDAGPYTALMAASQAMVAAEVIAAIPLRRHACLLDVGGGDGTFLSAVGSACPDLRLMLFDLPEVAERASARLRRDGLGARATAHGGDFHKDGLPPGADIVTLVRIVHDHDDDAVRSLLARVHDALPPRGRLVIAEPMRATRGADSVGAYFALYLHAMGSGRPRTPGEIADFCREAGFTQVRRVHSRAPLIASIVTGVRG